MSDAPAHNDTFWGFNDTAALLYQQPRRAKTLFSPLQWFNQATSQTFIT